MAIYFSAVNACASLETLRSVSVFAFFFEDHNDFLHQTVNGSVRGCAEKNACPSSLGVKVPRRTNAVITLSRSTHKTHSAKLDLESSSMIKGVLVNMHSIQA